MTPGGRDIYFPANTRAFEGIGHKHKFREFYSYDAVQSGAGVNVIKLESIISSSNSISHSRSSLLKQT
jgi:hypothetical protein